MKKLILLFAVLCSTVGSWADFQKSWTNAPTPWSNTACEDAPSDVTELSEACKGQDAANSDFTHTIHSASKQVKSLGGDVEISFTFTNGSHALVILGVDLVGLDGTVKYSHYERKKAGGTSGASNNTPQVYVFTDVEAGDYILRYFVCNRANDHEITQTNGKIKVTGLDLGINVEDGGQVENNTWSTDTWAQVSNIPGDVTAVEKATYPNKTSSIWAGTFLITANAGQLKTQFTYSNGGKRLDILGAELLGLDGNVLDYDYHFGYAGTNAQNNDYFLSIDESGTYRVRYWVSFCAEANQSHGPIKFYHTSVNTIKEELGNLITSAEVIKSKEYLGEARIQELQTKIDAAQEVCLNNSATTSEIIEQKDALTAAIYNAEHVTTVEGFSNNFVYTFVSARNATSYMMYDGSNDFVASKYKQTGLEVGTDKVNCQWAVYKSDAGYYYMYNLGAQKFMGTQSAHNTGIPFSASPQTISLQFKISDVIANHPIMISPNGGSGAVNHSNNTAFTNNYGVVNWSNGGYNQTGDPGNVHAVMIVGAIDDDILNTIEEAVNEYETRGYPIQQFGEYLTYFNNTYNMGNRGWRDAPGVNNYTLQEGEDGDATSLKEAYDTATEFYGAINDDTTLESINEQKAKLQAVEGRLSINQPEPNKFYRLRCTTNNKYIHSTINTSNDNRLNLINNPAVEAAFCFYNNALVSYTNGLSIKDWAFNAVGTYSTAVFSEASNGVKGCYNIRVGSKFLYGAGNDLDRADNVNAHNGYNWWLEEVTTLPLTFYTAALGYATFNAPVAVQLPEGVSAYVGKIQDENTLKMYRIEGDKVPANTPVLLYKDISEATENVSVNLNVLSEEVVVEGLEGKDAFVGTVAAANLDATKNCYSLQKSAEEGANVVGFYSKTTGTKAGFKAWVETDKTSEARSFRIIFDGDDATGIKEALGLQNENVEIYDLSGRRLDKPTKGVNVVGGKVMIVR